EPSVPHGGDHCAMIPERSTLTAVETLPQAIALDTEILDDIAQVVQLVGGRDQQRGRVNLTYMREVVLFALTPRRFGLHCGIGAGAHNVGDSLAKPLSDFAHGSAMALVFERVVQQTGDCLILVTAVIEYEAGDREQMGNVGDL